ARARLSAPRRWLSLAEWGQDRDQAAPRVTVRADIPGGDAVTVRRLSGPRDAMSVRTWVCTNGDFSQRTARSGPQLGAIERCYRYAQRLPQQIQVRRKGRPMAAEQALAPGPVFPLRLRISPFDAG